MIGCSSTMPAAPRMSRARRAVSRALATLNGSRPARLKATSGSVSLRPDVWVLPFLNVYAIFGQGKGSTEVGYSIWLPDSSGGETKVTSLSTKVDFDATTVGFGLTPTIGVGGGWLALDMNFTWTDVPQLDQQAQACRQAQRLGAHQAIEHPRQRLSVQVLHRNGRAGRVLDDLVGAHHVRMIHARAKPRLAQKHGDELRIAGQRPEPEHKPANQAITPATPGPAEPAVMLLSTSTSAVQLAQYTA